MICCFKGSENPNDHAVYVWKELIKPRTKAQNIAIVAHSYGGLVVTHLVRYYHRWFLLSLGFAVESSYALKDGV